MYSYANLASRSERKYTVEGPYLFRAVIVQAHAIMPDQASINRSLNTMKAELEFLKDR